MSGSHAAVEERRLTNHTGNSNGRETQPKSGLWKKAGVGGVTAILLMAMLIFSPAPARAGANAAGQVSIGISVGFGPPPLPVYTQPICPGPGYIWTPGYWAYSGDDGYYWVPGTWVMAPFQGALWTPGYWGWDPDEALFVWHPGYWGLRVGFYGGINYGFGYFGHGYEGGFWRHGFFYYNEAVDHIDDQDERRVYYRERFYHRRWDPDRDRISYNGGRGGIDARPTRDDFRAERERRMGPLREQFRQERMARRMPEERWSVNRGRPRIAATRRPEWFHRDGAVRATRAGGPYRGGRSFDHGRQFDHGRHFDHGHQFDQGRPQNRQWHSFGSPNGRAQRFDHGGNRGGQQQRVQNRANGNWRTMRQPRSHYVGRGQFSQPAQRGGQQHGFQPSRQPQQRSFHPQQQRQRNFHPQQQRVYSQPRNGGYRPQPMNRNRGSRMPQQRYQRQPAPAQHQRHSSARQPRQPRQNHQQGNRGDSHHGRHRG